MRKEEGRERKKGAVSKTYLSAEVNAKPVCPEPVNELCILCAALEILR